MMRNVEGLGIAVFILFSACCVLGSFVGLVFAVAP
jgi:hypothetical protein